jgi:hypothetical protein
MLDFLAKNPIAPTGLAQTPEANKSKKREKGSLSRGGGMIRKEEILVKPLKFESDDFSRELEQKILRSHQITNEFLSFLDSFGQRTVAFFF